jgi:hypothetical protein
VNVAILDEGSIVDVYTQCCRTLLRRQQIEKRACADAVRDGLAIVME